MDGIIYFNFWEVDAMWFDAHYFPECMQDRVWVVAVAGSVTRPVLRKSNGFSLFEVHDRFRNNAHDGNKAFHRI